MSAKKKMWKHLDGTPSEEEILHESLSSNEGLATGPGQRSSSSYRAQALCQVVSNICHVAEIDLKIALDTKSKPDLARADVGSRAHRLVASGKKPKESIHKAEQFLFSAQYPDSLEEIYLQTIAARSY